MQKTAILIFLALTLATAGPARAHEVNRFGSPSTWVPNGRVGFDVTNNQPPQGESSNTTYIGIEPGVLYFVTRNLALGGNVSLGYSTTGSGDAKVTALGLGFAPRAGYNFAFTDSLTLFPTAGFSYQRIVARQGTDNTGEVAQSTITVEFFIPLLIHHGNAFIGIGPFLEFDVRSKIRVGAADTADNNQLTRFGIESVIGIWF